MTHHLTATALITLLLTFVTYNVITPAPDRSFHPSVIQSAGNASVRVWVNTNSGVYHCPGTRWYGNTKSGQYMTQKQAQYKGYRPAYGSVCG